MSEPIILVIEPILSGHHIRYLEWIVQGAAERRRPILLVTGEDNIGNERIDLLKKQNPGFFDVVYRKIDYSLFGGVGMLALLKREVGFFLWMKNIVKEISRDESLDYVLIPFIDYCLYAMAIFMRPFGPIQWSGVAMRPAFHFLKMGINGPKASFSLRLKEILFFRLLKSKTLRKIFLIDPCLYEYTKLKAGREAPVSYVAEPVEMHPLVERSAARNKLGITDSAKVVLLYGAIDFRKGVRELIEAAASENLKSNIVVLVVGMQSDDVVSYMKSASPSYLRNNLRLIEINKYVSDKDEALAFGAADVVWLGYRGHFGMSGVLVQAAYNKIPVLACNEGLLGWLTCKYSLGLCVDIAVDSEVVRGLKECIKINTSSCKDAKFIGSYASFSQDLFGLQAGLDK